MGTWLPLLVAAVAGLAAWLLTPVVAGVVPARSLWLRARVHVPVAVATGAGAAVLAGSAAEVVAFTAAGVGCALLAVIDLAVHRLPNPIVATTYLALFVPLVAAAATGDAWADLGRAVLAAIVLVAGYFVLAFISPAGLGLGDVKFAGVVGGFLGWFGWPEVAIGTLLAFVLNGLIALVVLVSRRGSMRSDVPFGPAMMAGALLAVAIG